MINGSTLRHGSVQGTILLVEQDVTRTGSLITGLQDRGFRVLHATDGRQGLRYVRAAQPDLVLLDVMLPQVDGFAVCRTLREESVVPIIMLSANGHAEDRVRGLELGADDVVARPFDPCELIAQVQPSIADSAGQAGRNALDLAGYSCWLRCIGDLLSTLQLAFIAKLEVFMRPGMRTNRGLACRRLLR